MLILGRRRVLIQYYLYFTSSHKSHYRWLFITYCDYYNFERGRKSMQFIVRLLSFENLPEQTYHTYVYASMYTHASQFVAVFCCS